VREVREFRADWDDPEQRNYEIRRPKSMQGKLGIWKPVQSGFDGPLVLQFV